MTYPDIRLIASDMDGTLLSSDHQLSDVFFELFKKLHRRGILFAAASGRQYFNLRKVFEAIRDDIVFVAENGSYVVYKDEELLVQDLDRDAVHRFIDIGRQIPDSHLIVCGKKKAYVESTSPAFMDHVLRYFEKYEVVEDLKNIANDQFLKFTICDLGGSEGNSYPHFKNFEQAYQVKVSGNIWLDISHLLANKGRALSILQEKYAIGIHQTVAFGDYLNDIEMMQQAHFSYAMANAHPDVKNAARFLTGSNDENGVLRVLESLVDSLEKSEYGIPT